MVVAEAVAQLEAEGMVLGFELLPDLVQLLPGVGELLDPDLGKPVGAPVHQLPDVAVRDRPPFAVDNSGFPGRIVPAALLLAGLLGDVADIHQLVGIEERVEQEDDCYIGSRPGLDDRADPGRRAADAGQLVIDLHAGLLFVSRRQCLLHVLVERGDERGLVQKGKRLALRARAPRANRGGCGPEPGEFEKPAA